MNKERVFDTAKTGTVTGNSARLICLAGATFQLLAACAPLQNENVPYVPTDGGPLGTGVSDVTVSRPDRSTFRAVVHYPVQDSREGVPHGRIAYPLPAIAFGHAYLCPVELYTSTLDHLASQGYVVIASRSGGEPFPDHARFAADLSHCLTFLAEQNESPASIWHQQVDMNRFGLLGHSMGGGAAVLAAADDPRVKAVATLAAAETRTSAIAAASRLSVPYCALLGTEDRITPGERHALAIWEAAGAARVLLLIQGGSHCGFLDRPFIFCDEGSITRADQLAVTWERVTAFFDDALRGLPDGRTRLLAPASPPGPGLEIRAEDPNADSTR